MNMYESEAVKDTEQFGLNLLNNLGIKCKKNNETDKTNVDIITENNKKIDVQYSNNFGTYGEYRADIVSAYTPLYTAGNNAYIYNKNISLIENFEKRYNCEVIKEGKIYQQDYVDYLIVFFYKHNYIKNQTEDILIIKKESILKYISDNEESLFKKIIKNNKSIHFLDDKHGSAFLPIKISILQENFECFFGSLQNLYNQKDKIVKYIG